MSICAVLWDIDGTLINSEPLHLQALLKTCATHGVDIRDLPPETFVGVNLNDVWSTLQDRYPDRLTKAQWLAEINHYYSTHAKALVAMPHALRVVEQLSLAGVVQAAVSNSHRCIVDANLDSIGVKSFMRFALSLEDVPAAKPDPAPYLMALEKLGLNAQQVITVEDSPAGVMSARAAGLPVLGYINGSGKPDMADRQISHLRQVIDYITPKAHGL